MLSTENATIRLAHWNNTEDKKMLSEIRRRVFIEEQNVPETLEWDEFDDSSKHYILSYEDKAIAVARLKQDGKIGRMAVLSNFRGNGFGSKLLQYILTTIDTTNLDHVYLHAQTTAISFYLNHGFISVGDVFYEANIPHMEMLKKL